MNEIFKHIQALSERRDLFPDEATRLFQIIMKGGATPAQIAAVLMGLHLKGETEIEITAAAQVIRAKAAPFNIPQTLRDHVVDTCGTGGDAAGTYNISTAVAFVVAGCGVPVAKHGNRAVSSRSGSADVLEALGVNIAVEPPVMERALQECHLCFLMAPKYHQAMRHVGPVRQELGIRTIFNLLGPLSNPVGAKHQLLGVYDRDRAEILAHVLKNLGCIHAWVVHGLDGLDELTITDNSYVAELKDGRVNSFVLNPETVGIQKVDAKELKGGTAEDNAQALMAVLRGSTGAYRDVVVLNAAAALMVADVAKDLHEGIAHAERAIDSGGAREVLARLIHITSGTAS